MLAPPVLCSANLMLVQQPVEGWPGYPQDLGGNAQVVAVGGLVHHARPGALPSACSLPACPSARQRCDGRSARGLALRSAGPRPAPTRAAPVGQLAHIARPVMFAHGYQCVFTEAAGTAARFVAVEMGKMVGQHRQIAIALTQGRSRDLQHVQTIIRSSRKPFSIAASRSTWVAANTRTSTGIG